MGTGLTGDGDFSFEYPVPVIALFKISGLKTRSRNSRSASTLR